MPVPHAGGGRTVPLLHGISTPRQLVRDAPSSSTPRGPGAPLRSTGWRSAGRRGRSARARRRFINCPAHRAPGRAGRPEDNPGPPGVRRRRCGGVAGNSIWAVLAVPEPGRFRWLVLISPAGLGRFARAGSRQDGRRNDPTVGLGSRRLRRHSQAVRASGAPLKICSSMPLTSQRSTGAVRMGLGAAASARYAAVEQGGPETPFPAPITKHRHVDGVVWLGEHKSLLGPPTT